MNQDGFARFATIENLALRARVSLEEAKIAEQAFLSPDPHSSNPENEGRRIEKVPGGYVILNAHVYRALATQLHQREQNRERVNRYRSKNQGRRKKSITRHYTALHPVSVYASDSVSDSPKGEYEGERIPKLEMALKWLKDSLQNGADFTEKEVRSAFLALSANGWMWGRNPIMDWRAALERQINNDRDKKPMNNGRGAHSILDMKTVLAAKEKKAKAIREKFAADCPMGLEWKDQSKKEEYFQICKEMRTLNDNISKAL